LLALEQRLQQINPNLCVPFWDWSYDWISPLSSPIFSSRSMYKLDVKLSSSGDCRYKRNVPYFHCLSRQYSSYRFSKYYSSKSVAQMIITETNYDDFRKMIEYGPHGQVHNSLGGDVASMYSPNDPIFFLLHSSLDFIWWQWQQLNTDVRYSEYVSGLDEILPPFDVSIGDMVNADGLCYTYQPYSKNTVLTTSSLNSLMSSSAEDASIPPAAPEEVAGCVPANVTDPWMEMNNLDPEEVRLVEAKFHTILTRTAPVVDCQVAAQQQQVALAAAGGTDNHGNQFGTDSVTPSGGVDSIPGWGVGLIAVFVCLVTLVTVLLVLLVKPYAR